MALPVCGEDISVTTPTRVCNNCGKPVYDDELDTATLEAAFAVYRTRHDIITPVEIRELRETYGLSKLALAKLLGVGDITIQRYEAGNIPDEAHNLLLRFIQDPWNLKQVAERNAHRLTATGQKRLFRTLTEVIENRTPEKILSLTGHSGVASVDHSLP